MEDQICSPEKYWTKKNILLECKKKKNIKIFLTEYEFALFRVIFFDEIWKGFLWTKKKWYNENIFYWIRIYFDWIRICFDII